MPLRVVSIKMDEETIEIINEIASKRGITRSEFIREAIRYYIDKHREFLEAGKTPMGFKNVKIYI